MKLLFRITTVFVLFQSMSATQTYANCRLSFLRGKIPQISPIVAYNEGLPGLNGVERFGETKLRTLLAGKFVEPRLERNRISTVVLNDGQVFKDLELIGRFSTWRLKWGSPKKIRVNVVIFRIGESGKSFIAIPVSKISYFQEARYRQPFPVEGLNGGAMALLNAGPEYDGKGIRYGFNGKSFYGVFRNNRKYGDPPRIYENGEQDKLLSRYTPVRTLLESDPRSFYLFSQEVPTLTEIFNHRLEKEYNAALWELEN